MRLRRMKLILLLLIICIVYTYYLLVLLETDQSKSKYKWTKINMKLNNVSVDLNEMSSNILYSRHKSVNQFIKHSKRDDFGIEADVDIKSLNMYETIDFNKTIDLNTSYNMEQWNETNKLKVYLILHSHNEPGLLKTLDEYYKSLTSNILLNIVNILDRNPNMKFVWCETVFLSLWWNDTTSRETKTLFKRLLHSGQIEIVTGGWVMNDEANSHWLSVIQQLTAGHQWLMDNMEYIPHNGWAIDPFGHSSTQAYLLKLTEFNNILIQRVHYRVKQEFALNKQLEFRWRQSWDRTGKTDLLTHISAYSGYTTTYTCGPNSKVCCQFNFRRGNSYEVDCPYVSIRSANVKYRSKFLLEQWRQKAQIFRSNSINILMGDDFSWAQADELEKLIKNYKRIMQYINSDEKLNTEVKWGTLSDYFNSVLEDVKTEQFPTYSGDFFTYANLPGQYWSGYFTSGTGYKALDRVALAYLRAAELISAQWLQTNSGISSHHQLHDKLNTARNSLSLFQHHNAITGTSTQAVMLDYASRLLEGISSCQNIIQEAAFFLLGGTQNICQKKKHGFMEHTSVWLESNNKPGTIDIRTIHINRDQDDTTTSNNIKIIVYNTLVFRRVDLITVHVTTPYVRLFDSANAPVEVQISPVITNGMTISNTKYALSWYVNMNAMSLSVYTLTATTPEYNNEQMIYSKLTIYNNKTKLTLPNIFHITTVSNNERDIILSVLDLNKETLLFNSNGFLQAVNKQDEFIHISIDFIRSIFNNSNEGWSGAYITRSTGFDFIEPISDPLIIRIEGPLISSLHVAQRYVEQTVSIMNNPSKVSCDIEIINYINLSTIKTDYEIFMRLKTDINSDMVFYTDSNGMQMIKRKFMPKLPIPASIYPLSSAVYIQDNKMRLTVLTSVPLGVISNTSGHLAIEQDRMTFKNDNIGLYSNMIDNIPTRNVFRILIENNNCEDRDAGAPDRVGALSVTGHVTQHQLLSPLISMTYRATDDDQHQGIRVTDYTAARQSASVDTVLASYRPSVIGKMANGDIIQGYGAIIHRTYLDMCYTDKQVLNFYPVGDGNVELSDFIETSGQMYNASLTFVNIHSVLNTTSIKMNPMDVVSVFIKDESPMNMKRSSVLADVYV